MDIALLSFATAAAALCAGLMGYAIQRGATCTVAAVEEVMKQGSACRLGAIVEASVWVAGGLLLAQALHALPSMPHGYPVTRWTVGGGILLGLGAFINRACVFGAVARLGSGEWAYVATPLGFLIGCVGVERLSMATVQQPLQQLSPVLQASGAGALLFAVFAAVRLAMSLRPRAARTTAAALRERRRASGAAEAGWTPHAATTMIGVTFVLMMLLVGAWAYTDLLADLARGMHHSLAARGLLLLALLLGAAWGGWRAGRFRRTQVTFARLFRCLLGGALMGCGTLLIPGSNDGLILVGMPLLWPYAWVAFLTMCVSIAAAQLVVNHARWPALLTF